MEALLQVCNYHTDVAKRRGTQADAIRQPGDCLCRGVFQSVYGTVTMDSRK